MSSTSPAYELVARYKPQLEHQLFRRSIPRHQWPDLLQELRIRLWQAGERGVLTPERDPFNYVFTLLTNLVIDWNRHEWKRKAVRGQWDERIEERHPAFDGPDALELVHRADMHERLQRAISHLPAKCAVVMDHVLQERPLEELAQELDVSNNVIRRWAFRGRALLRKQHFLR